MTTRLSDPALEAAGLVVDAECAPDDPRISEAIRVVLAAHAIAPFGGVVTLGEGVAGLTVTITAPLAGDAQ